MVGLGIRKIYVVAMVSRIEGEKAMKDIKKNNKKAFFFFFFSRQYHHDV